jgi:hypothetical protein
VAFRSRILWSRAETYDAAADEPTGGEATLPQGLAIEFLDGVFMHGQPVIAAFTLERNIEARLLDLTVQ